MRIMKLFILSEEQHFHLTRKHHLSKNNNPPCTKFVYEYMVCFISIYYKKLSLQDEIFSK
jgi:hypothetical protein